MIKFTSLTNSNSIKMNNNSSSTGIGFFGVLTIVFIILKLTGSITWSWWYVLAPLWGPLALVLVLIPPIVIYENKKRLKREKDLKRFTDSKN